MAKAVGAALTVPFTTVLWLDKTKPIPAVSMKDTTNRTEMTFVKLIPPIFLSGFIAPAPFDSGALFEP